MNPTDEQRLRRWVEGLMRRVHAGKDPQTCFRAVLTGIDAARKGSKPKTWYFHDSGKRIRNKRHQRFAAHAYDVFTDCQTTGHGYLFDFPMRVAA